MTTLSSGDIMLAAALVFGLATACQVIAPLLRIPALILLLPAGFVLGLAAPQFRADQILGPAFPVIVDLMVAVILFQGGMKLGSIPLQGADKSVVRRLVWIGGALTFIAGALAAYFLLDFTWSLAILLGAILIVSGPTVVTPILDFARPKPRVRGILMWEGTLLDPLGAIFAVVIFQAVRVSDANASIDAFFAFLSSMAIAILVAAAGVVVIILGLKLVHGNRLLETQVLIGTVLVAAGLANFLADGSGLLAALLMGASVSVLAKRFNAPLQQADPFFDTVVSIGIGVLFISIAALVPSPAFAAVALPAFAMAVLLILVVRPVVAFICTGRASLTRNERIFIGVMDPRGIVAAATASSVGAALVTAKMPGAEKVLPAAFMIILVTVFVYGLAAVPVAQALGLREKVEVEQ
jgi:NhaP-type Na+/H+ or K+/H+ antiporter